MDGGAYEPIYQKQRRSSSLEDLLLLRRQRKQLLEEEKKQPRQPKQRGEVQASHRQLTTVTSGIRRNPLSLAHRPDGFSDGGGGSGGGCSQAAKKLGRYIDEELCAAFGLSSVGNADNRRQCISHVIRCLDKEILRSAAVRSDLQAYEIDLCGFPQSDGAAADEQGDVARRTLSNLESRVATLRDRLLFPLHYQQLIDLSHLCGCIHAVRMRLGFVREAKQQQQRKQQQQQQQQSQKQLPATSKQHVQSN